MKTVKTVAIRDIKIVANGAVRNDKWAQIRDKATGEILHTGQLRYIRRVAKNKYNRKAEV